MMRMRSFRGGGASGSADSVVAPVVTHFPLFLRRQSRFKTDESAATPPSPPAYRTTARISIRPEAPMPFPSEEERFIATTLTSRYEWRIDRTAALDQLGDMDEKTMGLSALWMPKPDVREPRRSAMGLEMFG
ncbi:hypothetical protein Tco_1211953 [Tanacetum coccineum]